MEDRKKILIDEDSGNAFTGILISTGLCVVAGFLIWFVHLLVPIGKALLK